MKSKRFKKLPKKTSVLPAEVIEKLLPAISFITLLFFESLIHSTLTHSNSLTFPSESLINFLVKQYLAYGG